MKILERVLLLLLFAGLNTMQSCKSVRDQNSDLRDVTTVVQDENTILLKAENDDDIILRKIVTQKSAKYALGWLTPPENHLFAYFFNREKTYWGIIPDTYSHEYFVFYNSKKNRTILELIKRNKHNAVIHSIELDTDSIEKRYKAANDLGGGSSVEFFFKIKAITVSGISSDSIEKTKYIFE